MARAGGREVGGEVTIDAVTQPDQDARGKSRFRLRHRAIEARRRGASEPLQRGNERALRGQELEAFDPQGSDRADAGEVGAVLVGGRRPDATAELDPIPRYHRGV